MNQIKNCKFVRVMNAQAAGKDDTLSANVVDMSGYDAVTFVALLGDITATAVLTLQAQQGEKADASDAATLAGTAAQAAAAAADQDNKVLVLEVVRPRERYVRAQLVRATANAVVDGVIAILHQAKEKPVVQDTTVLSAVLLQSPAEA